MDYDHDHDIVPFIYFCFFLCVGADESRKKLFTSDLVEIVAILIIQYNSTLLIGFRKREEVAKEQ